MKNIFFRQIWVALKIWVIALATNTLLGSLLISHGLSWWIMRAGIVFGSIFSFPIFCILLIVIAHCISRRKNGLQLFTYVLIAGLSLTAFSSILFSLLIDQGIQPGIIMITLFSAAAGITSQYGALYRLTDYDKKLEKFLS